MEAQDSEQNLENTETHSKSKEDKSKYLKSLGSVSWVWICKWTPTVIKSVTTPIAGIARLEILIGEPPLVALCIIALMTMVNSLISEDNP